MNITRLVDKLKNGERLSDEELLYLLKTEGDDVKVLTEAGRQMREAVYGGDIYIRGLIEV